IGGRDLLQLATVDETMREITALAEGVIGAAVDGVRAGLAAEWGEALVAGPEGSRPAGFVVLGMGKLGGEELNYSSDVDLVYVYERDGSHPGGRTLAQFFSRLAEEVTRALAEVTADGFCFRVDLRLRPGGREGPITTSLAAALTYYEAWAETWERAAWLKARPVAGDRALGRTLLEELVPFVYRRYLDFATIEEVKALKRQVDASLRAPEAAERDVKLGRGGIRELEFVVQAHQLVHGGKDARIRQRSTLAALDALAASGYLGRDLAPALAAAYRFLRDVEHQLQIVHDRQTQLLPRSAEEMAALARRLGLPDREALASVLGGYRATVQAAFDALFDAPEAQRRREERPELAALVDELEDEASSGARLGGLGFRDPAAAYRDLRLLRDGPPHAPASARRRQALSRLAPSLLAEIAGSAAPDRALRHVATFISTIGARTSYLHLLLENSGVMRLLVHLFATSEFLSAFFLRHPELLDSLVRADLVQTVRSAPELATELATRLAAAPDREAELDTLRRFRHEELLRIGVHDIQGALLPHEVAQQLTGLAEVCLVAALGLARRDVLARLALPLEPSTEGLAVVGMGKLGGAELSYASDLDLLFIYAEGGAASGSSTPREFFARVAQRTLSFLQTPTREGIAYHIDTRLRPSGNQGPLVSTLGGFSDYHERSAQLWERQALIKARVLSGPPELRAQLDAVVARFVYGRGLTAAEVTEIARMRERIAQERGGGVEEAIAIKTGRGGLVDVEFLVQMLQLRHGHAHASLRTPTTRLALVQLEACGLVPTDDARALSEGYAFLRALESRLRLERDQAVEAVEDDPEVLTALARRLGYEGADTDVLGAVRTDLMRHRSAIRDVYDRHFAAAQG
ncbi:MAG TPA: bifunctional [glutamate--ammonia ligase]-adenylyl-L-tyrosine phosphorylase/[glutamate--ammonia-ligase] adenylyltransferase, partial [Candidatus Nitrosopolaris sp.]|nr:bifunctional [glutamate--ammonia ligase]-adenylyl-L-tyrosine phosphorylase/[glutamate--ammonia-ligase] adenylyltransferase [Candidatus Nitrosopolaris sp.]